MDCNKFWPNRSPVFLPEDLKLFEICPPEGQVGKVTVKEVVRNSRSFPIDFPIETVTCEYLRTKGIPDQVLERNINSVYPVLHEAALPLFHKFLYQKKRFGSCEEKKLYQDFTVQQLVDRLLTKRAVVFRGRSDKFMLLDGLVSVGDWETIGTSEEEPPWTLQNCLSYDEIKLSALLSVSSYTHFINNGARDNCGEYTLNRNKLEKFGVIIGLTGARLEKPEVMEYREVVVSKEQNIQENGYGESFVPTMQGVFSNFYEEPNLTYRDLEHQLVDKKKFTKLSGDNNIYFNNHVYEKRLSLSIDTLLLEANARAKELDKMAYVHVVGIGLGAWRISSHQNKVFMNAFCKRIRFLGINLNCVSDICFSYIEADSCGKYRDQDIIPIAGHTNEGIKIHFKNRNPHNKLVGNNQGKLLVVSYARNGNSLPGNVFWFGVLDSGGDPATACSTQVAELHNPHINPKVSAANLRIATLNGLVPFHDYVATAKTDV